jgi:hypothetical protein
MKAAMNTAWALIMVTLIPDARMDWSLSFTPRMTSPMSWFRNLRSPKVMASVTMMRR